MFLSMFFWSVAVAAQQGGGIVWSNQLTFTADGDKIEVIASEIVTAETVEYWEQSENGGNGGWKKVEFGSPAVPKKNFKIDLGGNYLEGTVFRVLCRCPGSTMPEVSISQPGP